jgi:hypothetical protein
VGKLIRRIGVAAALIAAGFMVFVAQATAATYSNPTPITIPAGAPTTTSGPATPYPSQITVSALQGTISKLTVTLSGYSHTVPADVGAVLIAPGGQALELMNCSGGFATAAPINLTFDDMAAMQIAQLPAPVTGTYRPADHCSPTFSYSPPGPGTAYGNPGPGHGSPPFATLSSTFNGLDPNGTWKLFVQDFSGGDVGTISGGWSLDLTGPTTGQRAAALKKCKKKFKKNHNKKKFKKCKKRANQLPV